MCYKQDMQEQMKMRLSYFPVVAAIIAFVLPVRAWAQDFDTNPTAKIDNATEDLHFTVGARLMADMAYYNVEESEMKSGMAVTDARIRTSMKYRDWYFYADFDFTKGKFSQKNIFVQYSVDKGENHHTFKGGYYNDPATMANNTSRGSLHFISRAAAANALSPGRELGFSYKFYNRHFFANQGAFAENLYNDQANGPQGFTLGGRWLYIPIDDSRHSVHVGASARFANTKTGERHEDGEIETTHALSSTVETYVDGNKQFLSCTMPWTNNSVYAGVEALYRDPKFFVRGEYMLKHINRKSSKGLPHNTFHGGYVEAGWLIFGNPYRYNRSESVISGLGGKGLEISARYSYLNLNDKDVHGGRLHSATVGGCFAFNKFFQAILEYSYSRIDNLNFPLDKNMHIVQARMMFSF